MSQQKPKYTVGELVEARWDGIGEIVEIVWEPKYKVKLQTNYIKLYDEVTLYKLSHSPKYKLGDIVTTKKGKVFRTVTRIQSTFRGHVYSVSGLYNNYLEEDLNPVFQQ